MVEATREQYTTIKAVDGNVTFENVMIAANANTVFNAVSYNERAKLVAYAASNTVLIYDPFCSRKVDGEVVHTPKVLFGLN